MDRASSEKWETQEQPACCSMLPCSDNIGRTWFTTGLTTHNQLNTSVLIHSRLPGPGHLQNPVRQPSPEQQTPSTASQQFNTNCARVLESQAILDWGVGDSLMISLAFDPACKSETGCCSPLALFTCSGCPKPRYVLSRASCCNIGCNTGRKSFKNPKSALTLQI